MLELTGVASILRGISILYWIVAVGVLLAVLWWARRWWGKLVGALVVIGVFGFFPAKGWIEAQKREAYAREAWAYFKKLCAEKSGEKIYKTFTGVKSVLVVKPLPPATEKDLYDQFWYGDPYSDSTPWGKRAAHSAGKLVYPDAPVSMGKRGKGLEFVESYLADGSSKKEQLVKIYYEPAVRDYRMEVIAQPVSRFGLTWEDISTPEDRKYWVAASRLRAIDLTNNTIVAERTGYFIEAGFGSKAGQRRPWLASKGPSSTCPYSHDWSDRWFVLKVFNPAEDTQNGK